MATETLSHNHRTNAEPAQPSSSTDLAVEGMTCNNCARHVREAIESVPGVRNARVNLAAKRALVHWSSDPHHPDAVVKAVKEAGYDARVLERAAIGEDEDHCRHSLSGWQLNLWVGVLGTVPLILGEWIFGFGPVASFRWFSFALAGVVQVVAGAPFYRGAWNQLKSGNSNMDTLVSLGSTTAFAYSAWALLSGAGGHLYFMEAAAIITVISVGHWLESRASARASAALRHLLELAPLQARRRSADGGETMVAVKELGLNDTIVLRPGDRVPTDAQVIEGASAVDESMLTGESAPVEKGPESLIYGGTSNLNGRLVARVSAVGAATALAHIIAAVERAQDSRADIQRLGDRVSSVFVPIVVVIAMAAGLWWGFAPEQAHRVTNLLSHFLWPAHPPVGAAAGFIIAAAVLIIACPCAMGLATPAAIMAGTNTAARRGILVRDGVALERAGNITAVLFDKTGTLTLGKPTVAAVWESTPNASRALAASLASESNHPVSQAIASVSTERLPLQDWQEIRGAGIKATLTAREQGGAPAGEVALGSLAWLGSLGVALAAGKAFVDEWTTKAATLVGLANGKKCLALFALEDPLKPGAAEVIQSLHQQGLQTFLVTGDHRATASSLATLAGIPAQHVFAEIRPEQKAEIVRQLQEKGERIAFVGDGINDAPALKQANLGIAVSKASDIAREAADLILLKSEIEAVPESLAVAKATLRTIKQNLFWAFFYNAVGIPLAALGFMTPVLCAAAMALSDLIVIGNALRLYRFNRGS
jgi:P-type Cu+ transporter